ncbi:hypothetical protein MCOR27_002392 [Pyricularia oryzae]|nr:hypothetical protein MCOR01_004113 [Pyricularia oryzae]KAI6259214.1 hypothetical protein MCOR19_004435 [Pyricularia oryzae]KAI6285249.1 hypothetical protein MCOR27_002392 [Pyricularia oryzae]KAI6325905.1 hypothetical protein MCOR29_003611 [Pyricularia oryzae]KAI6358637.1 hypothetical protein MCOR31_009774 [Pyricularia oryzae]
MKDTRAVCLLCRSLGAGTRRPIPPTPRCNITQIQWRSHSTPTPPASAPHAAKTTFGAPGQQDGSRDGAATEASAANQHTPRFRRSPPPTSTVTGNLAIFESVVRGQRRHQDDDRFGGKPAETPESTLDLKTYNDVAKLMRMTEQPKPDLSEAYDFFKTEIYPGINAAKYVPRVFEPELRKLIQRILTAMKNDPTLEKLPSLADVTLVALRLGVLDIKSWARAMQGRLEYLCLTNVSPEVSLEEYQEATGRIKMFFDDVAQSWKLVSLPHHVVMELDPHTPLADVDFRLPEGHNQRGESTLYYSLSKLLHAYAPLQLRPVIPLLLVTWVLFNDSGRCLPGNRAAASHFLASITGLVVRSKDSNMSPEKLVQIPGKLIPYVRHRWTVMHNQLKEWNDPKQSYLKHPTLIRKLDVTGSGRKHFLEVKKSLNKALSGKNSAMLERAWLDFFGHESPPSQKTIEDLQRFPSIWNQFIMAFNALRRPQRAIEVWNTMTQIGLEPTIKTFTAMMEGCSRGRNASALENIWDQIVELGVPLDTHAWTVRISGLIECGKADAGLSALDEMARIWNKQQTSGEPSAQAVQPSIVPVNAALFGILRINGIPAAMKILQWAERHNIEPDVITYNTLLQTMIRRAPEQVDAVLEMMNDQGVEPDEGTQTILIEGMGPYLRHAGPEEKLEAVKRIITMVTGNDPKKTNPSAYAKLMFELLKENESHAGTDIAVNHIMQEMGNRRLEPTTHMYTILVEHFLHRNPPALDAARKLIETHDLFNKPHIDHVFWERAISGFMNAGDVDSAFDLFERSKNGNMTMRLYEHLLRALIANGKGLEAARLVKAVDEMKSSTDEETESRFRLHAFWDIARQYGLSQ